MNQSGVIYILTNPSFPQYVKIGYDIVIGNPPWQSQLTNKANNYLKENKYIVGDKQIAQAFPIKCASICKETGVVCLLMPSKGLLFNRSPKSRAYRRRFFDENTVSVIINFSIYRKVLFDNATAPCTAIIYYPTVRYTIKNPSHLSITHRKLVEQHFCDCSQKCN